MDKKYKKFFYVTAILSITSYTYNELCAKDVKNIRIFIKIIYAIICCIEMKNKTKKKNEVFHPFVLLYFFNIFCTQFIISTVYRLNFYCKN